MKELTKYKYDDEKEKYVSKEMRKYKNYTIGYIVFVLVIIVLWFINYNHLIINKYLAALISLILFIGSNLIINLINHANVRDFFLQETFEISFRTKV